MYSRLRGSIGGVYNWRIANSKSPEEQQRMIQEADFAFRQSFAFCPDCPEAIYRYVNLLVQLGRIDDALLVVRTAVRLNPKDAQHQNIIAELERIRSAQPK
jgi:tetratricopeptide (TPR) repeat protein